MFPIKDLPVLQSATKEGLHKIVHMHHVFLIPAYDFQSHLIPSIQYHNWFEGAMVELHFELNHWSIGTMTPTQTLTLLIWCRFGYLSLPSRVLSCQWNMKFFTKLTLWSLQPRRAIPNVSSFPISYFISFASHPSSHSGLHVFSCMISYYHIPQVSFL